MLWEREWYIGLGQPFLLFLVILPPSPHTFRVWHECHHCLSILLKIVVSVCTWCPRTHWKGLVSYWLCIDVGWKKHLSFRNRLFVSRHILVIAARVCHYQYGHAIPIFLGILLYLHKSVLAWIRSIFRLSPVAIVLLLGFLKNHNLNHKTPSTDKQFVYADRNMLCICDAILNKLKTLKMVYK